MGLGLEEGYDCQLVSRDSYLRMGLGLDRRETVIWSLETYTIAGVLSLRKVMIVDWFLETRIIAWVLGLRKVMIVNWFPETHTIA